MTDQEIQSIFKDVLDRLGLQEKSLARKEYVPRIPDSRAALARFIDHTLLKPEAREQQIRQLCAEAREYRFASVCVNPCWIPLCVEELKDSGIPVCTVVGFPLGANAPIIKARETQQAVADGAREIDMVINVGRLLDDDLQYVYADIKAVVKAAGSADVKVIIETCLLSNEQKVRACALAWAAGAHFVKTSTGFNRAGATVEDVRLMRRTVGPSMGIKAAGGIRDHATALAMIKAGANRIGASASVAIVSAVE